MPKGSRGERAGCDRRSWSMEDVVAMIDARSAKVTARDAGRMTRHRKSTWLLIWGGCACLIMMILTHVAERLHILPGMGWGLPYSPGHYLDLISAVAGVVLLLAAVAVRLLHSN